MSCKVPRKKTIVRTTERLVTDEAEEDDLQSLNLGTNILSDRPIFQGRRSFVCDRRAGDEPNSPWSRRSCDARRDRLSEEMSIRETDARSVLDKDSFTEQQRWCFQSGEG